MSKITRPDLDVAAFASQAQSGERTVFGDSGVVSDDLTTNMTADLFRGWAGGLDPVNGFPPMEYFNGQMFTVSQLVSYLWQMGISEWNTNQFYPENARAMDASGIVWKSLQDHSGQAQAEGVYWTNPLINYVAKTGSETVGGIKTFTSSPIVPTPTTDFQAATKKYTDDSLGSKIFSVHDEKATGVSGGSFTQGGWRTRDLNAISENSIAGASLSANQITLPAGNYLVYSRAAAYDVNEHQIRLRDVTNSVTLAVGSSEFVGSSDDSQTDTFISFRKFILAGTADIELQHYCTSSQLTDGFGRPNSFGEVNIYGETTLWKL